MRAKGKIARPRANAEKRMKPQRESHEAHCRICRHPRRAEIDREFLSWESPRAIAAAHGLSKTAVYRHVEATGLIERRRERCQFALDRVIERAGEVEVTAGAVVAAIRLSAELDRDE